MTEFQFSYDSWPVEDFNILPGQEFDQPLITSDFPLVEELDPSFVEQFNMPKSNFQPYPPLWYEAGLVKQDCAMNFDSHFPENTPTLDELATQRALFMTPSAFPFPASPSDARSSPDPASAWEEESQPYALDLNLDQFQSPQLQSPQYQSSEFQSPNTAFSEDCFTPLEMPDGSTRLTSNWLPVDPDAGFTIAAPEEQFQDLKFAFFPSEAAMSYDR